MNRVIISHRQDVDGVFAAAIFLVRYPDGKVYFTNYGKDEMVRLEGIIRKEATQTNPRLIVISDFNLNENMGVGVLRAIEFAKSRGTQFVYLDHHEWSPAFRNHLKSMVELIINQKKCAAQLVRERFVARSELARSLADLASWADFVKLGPGLGPPLGALISYYNYVKNGEKKLVRLARFLAKGGMWSVGYNKDWRKFAVLQTRANKQLLASARTFNVGGFKVAVARMADFLQTSVACQLVLDFTKADLVAGYTPSGGVSFRRRQGNQTPLHEVARALNPSGGGHAFAAGSFLGHPVRDRNTARRAARQIIAAFRNVLA